MAVLPEREVEIVVIIQIHELSFYVVPVIWRIVVVVSQPRRSTVLVHRERAVSVVYDEVAVDVLPAGAVNPQV